MSKKQTYKAAAALSYDGEKDVAPLVSAKGYHLRADEIVRIARRYNIPVIEEEKVASTLMQTELDQPIPARLYEAVAVILNRLRKII